MLKHTSGSSKILLLHQPQTSLLLPVFSWKRADTIYDGLNILSHWLPAGMCAAVFVSPFTTALPRGSSEQLQLSANAYDVHFPGSTQLVGDL